MSSQELYSENNWGCDARQRRLGRRAFLRGGALALVGTAAVPAFLTRSVLAQSAATGKKLVVVFQRGAADGLNIVIPFRDPAYHALRPSIALPQGAVLPLDDTFGLHPAMASLKPLWDAGRLAPIHAAGSPDSTRSHFDAQDYMESGTPGVKSTPDGWLNRALQAEGAKSSPFRAVALGAQVPRTLQGRSPALALRSLSDFHVTGNGSAFEAMYDASSDTLLHGTGQETFEAVKMLRAADPARYQPAPGAAYPNSQFGNSMRQIAQLLKANLGVEAAFTDVGGWDTHERQGAAEGQLAGRLRDFADTLAAFHRDLGDEAENVLVVTMSEFGRTARENGTGGTDHGHANVMFALGGGVRGGRVYGSWPGLQPEQLHEGRDLAVTTDFRRVLAEAAQRTLGVGNPEQVFPGAALGPGGFLNFNHA